MPKTVVIDVSKGEQEVRDLTAAEVTQRKKDEAEAAVHAKAENDRIQPLSDDEITQLRALLTSR